jgi:hypothetical protein
MGGKINIAHAFCNIPLASLFAGHFAFCVSNYYYFELHLPFGFIWLLFVWNSFSDFIQRYCALQGVNCVVYCNDFLVLAPNKNDCFWDMSFLLGVLVKPSKVVWPSQSIKFLGLVLDFVAMTVLASPKRVASILDILRDFLSRKPVPFSKFERLVGKLSFVAQIISSGRTFLRCLFDAYPSSRHGCVKISSVYWCLRSWSPKFRGATIMIRCDNQAMMAWLNNGCTRSPLAMKFLRKIFWLRAKFDFHLVDSWIPTEANTMADAISGLDFARFLSCSGIPLSGISGNLFLAMSVIGKCCLPTTAVVARKCYSPTMAVLPLSRLSPLHHITLLILWSSGTC